MALLDNVQRIIVESFDPKEQNLVAKIAEIYNFFAENVTENVNGRISIDNLDRELIEIEVTVNSSGVPTITKRFKASEGMRGSKIIRALNQTNVNTYVDSCPFMSFTPVGGEVYTINKITGLEASSKYKLLIELIP